MCKRNHQIWVPMEKLQPMFHPMCKSVSDTRLNPENYWSTIFSQIVLFDLSAHCKRFKMWLVGKFINFVFISFLIKYMFHSKRRLKVRVAGKFPKTFPAVLDWSGFSGKEIPFSLTSELFIKIYINQFFKIPIIFCGKFLRRKISDLASQAKK